MHFQNTIVEQEHIYPQSILMVAVYLCLLCIDIYYENTDDIFSFVNVPDQIRIWTILIWSEHTRMV